MVRQIRGEKTVTDENIEHETRGSAVTDVKRCRYNTFENASCMIYGKGQR